MSTIKICYVGGDNSVKQAESQKENHAAQLAFGEPMGNRKGCLLLNINAMRFKSFQSVNPKSFLVEASV